MLLAEGYPKVLVESTLGVATADGGIHWNIPTNVISPHLRKFGSRFLLPVTGLTEELEAVKMPLEEMRPPEKYFIHRIKDE